MEHLALEIFNISGSGSKYAYLPEDTTITITSTSEIFSSGDIWSYSFQLNTHANAHIFGTSGELHGSRLHEQIDNRRARLWVEGLPLYLGYLKLGEEVEVDDDGNIDVAFESGQKTFEKMIEGAKANQVPMMNDVRFGVALYRKRWASVTLKLDFRTYSSDGYLGKYVSKNGTGLAAFESDGEDEYNSVQKYPRMVFPKGKFNNLVSGTEDELIDCLNTDSPYDDAHPYCNIALCYQKQGYTRKDQSGATYEDYSSEPEAQRGYEVMPANRVNSAPNFFVIYWIKALFKHLGIYIEENQMMDVEDLRRLFFVNTNCAYKEPEYLRDEQKYDGSLGKYQFGSGGDLVPEHFGNPSIYYNPDVGKITRWDGPSGIMQTEDCSLECTGFTAGEWHDDESGADVTNRLGHIDTVFVKIADIIGMTDEARQEYDGYKNKSQAKNRFLHDAIATSDCFPNVDISEAISALEHGFGIRLLFNDNYQRVRIILLRNIFRNENAQSLKVDIVNEIKEENGIRGFRMTYGDIDDTHFYYKGFADKLPHQTTLWPDTSDTHDYSHWNLNANYPAIINKISAFDLTCYVTPNTGNSYGIKVDKDAKRYDDLHPSLFEFAGFMDAEDGDCTGDDDTIETIEVGFTPAIVNDLNFEQERSAKTDDERKPQYALFVDETMRPRRLDLGDKTAPESYNDSDAYYSVAKLYEQGKGMQDGIVKPGEFAFKSDMYASKDGYSITVHGTYIAMDVQGETISRDASCEITNISLQGHVNEGYRLYLQDNYEPNDEGVSPVEKHDWGLTLGIMRGSGSDAYVDYSDDPDDEENETWSIVAGSNATTHSDTCDSYGNLWDYNGKVHVDSASEAEREIRARYPSTADTILDPRWPTSVQQIYDAGWEVSGDMTREALYYYYRLTIKSPSQGYVNVYATPIAADSSRSYMGPAVYTQEELKAYILNLWNQYMFDMTEHDNLRLIYAVNPSDWSDIAYLRAVYYGYTPERDLDNGLGITDGRFSLKLRAEKPNPYFDPTQPENSTTNRRYLEITNPDLRGRGLCDQFYKEYSYWVRNARVAKLTVRMELAQLLAIDKTVKVTIGDITGFIRKMQYSISNKTGLGEVAMEIMYI